MRATICVAAAIIASTGCSHVGNFSIGTTVPIDELHGHRDDLRGWIAGEIAAGRVERAFYAMELLKSRPFAAQQLLASSANERDIVAARTDLRPLFAEVFGDDTDSDAAAPLVAGRGLNIVSQRSASRFAELDVAADEAFWDDQRLFVRRIAAQLPYAHALRYSFAAATSEEALGMVSESDVALSFFVDGSRVHVFALRANHLEVTTLAATADELRQLTRALLDAVSTPPDSAADQSWLVPASNLYDALLAPLGQTITDPAITGLYVIPDGFLGSVPFSLLAEPEAGGARHILLDRMRVSYLPSITIYRRLMMREILDRPPTILAIGNPSYSVPVPDLPSAQLEARVVSHVFPAGTYLTGAGATEAAVTAQMVRHNVLHFATHGVLLGQHLAGASSLLVAAGDTDDGLLSAAEISGLDLGHVYLAVLSACETSVGSDGAASLDVASLAGAFMAAGAPSVIGSLWKVSDDSTTRLFVSFYSAFLELGAGDALRNAQRAVRRDPDLAHPYFWAAFVLYGWDK